MMQFREYLEMLTESGVEFIVIGGAAATAHGSPRFTQDVDIVYRRSPENIARIASALAPYKPYLRGAPPGLPFVWDERTIQRGLNFTLTTTLGDADFLGEVAGGGTYESLLPYAELLKPWGVDCHCVRLDKLIALKRAAGRPKDIEAIAELEAILEERENT